MLPMAHAQESAATRLSKYDHRVRDIVAKMTLDEKVGQMTQPDQEFMKDPADL
jgi:beta-glucosidase